MLEARGYISSDQFYIRPWRFTRWWYWEGSLVCTTLVKMVVRIALVILETTAISYLHLMSILETQTQEQLQKYIIGQRESHIFTLATDNQAVLKQALLKQLKEFGDRDPKTEFDQRFFKWSDGTTRNV